MLKRAVVLLDCCAINTVCYATRLEKTYERMVDTEVVIFFKIFIIE